MLSFIKKINFGIFAKVIASSFVASILILQPCFAVLPDESVIDYYGSQGIYYYNPDGSADACGSSTRLPGDNVKEKIWNYFIDKGFSDAQVAGIVGNGMAESGLTPTRSSNGSYWGIFQWGPRRPDLWAIMEQEGLGQYTSSEYWHAGAEELIPEDDLDHIITVELDFLMSPVDDAWVDAIKEANNPELAAEIFLTTFERAVNGNDPITLYGPYMGLLYQGTSKRRQFARETYDEYSGHGVAVSASSGSGKNVSIIGDSITVGATGELKAKFTDIADDQINARVSRPWNEGIREAQNMDLKDVVVFALGTNNSAPAINQNDINNLLAVTGNSRTIVLVTNYGPAGYEQNNELFRELAKSNSNIILADWNEAVSEDPGKYLASDNVHPNAEGAKLFAELIYDAVSSAGSGLCSVSGNFQELVLSYAWPTYHPAPYVDRMPAYAEAVTQSQSEGRYVGGSVFGVPGIDCGGFVTILMQNSGVASDYNTNPSGATGRQEQWVQENGWTLLNANESTTVDTNILQAGDVAFSNGHTWIYVGEIPGFDSVIASASYGESSARAPMAGTESPLVGNGAIVRWYRNPNYNPQNTTGTRATTAGGLLAN